MKPRLSREFGCIFLCARVETLCAARLSKRMSCLCPLPTRDLGWREPSDHQHRPQRAASLMLPSTSERYTLDAASLRDTTVRLNGRTLEVGIKDDLPRVAGVRTVARTLTFEPTTITF